MKAPVILDEYGDRWSTLLRPECEFHCTHIDAVAVTTNSDSTDGGLIVHTFGEDSQSSTSARAIRPDDRVGELSYRRHAITLIGYCESGHQVTISFAQHKGSTLVSAETWDTPDEEGLLREQP